MPGSLRFLTFVALLLTGGCAGTRIADLNPVPKELPAGFQSKFEVIEPTAVPAPGPSPSPSPGRAKRAAKKGKTKEAPAFVYPNRRTKQAPVWVGEQQVLEVTYLGLKAGDFTLDVLPLKQVAGRTVYHLRAHAETSSVMNLFYRLNDTVESYWDFEGFFSHRFHLLLDQTKQKRDSLELYDSETKKTFYWNRRNHVERGISETKETFDFSQVFPQDGLSALYYLRTLPLEDGKVYTFPVVSEGKEWDAVVTVIRREVLDTPLGRKSCVVVRPETRYQGVMRQEKGASYIWLTDDDRRYIVRVEAHVKVGAIAARLKSVAPGEKPNAE